MKNHLLSLFKRLTLFSLLTAVVVFASFEPARAEIVIGGEFEFVDFSVPFVPGKGMKGHEREMAERMAQAVRRMCPECLERTVTGKWGKERRFILPDGFWFQISWDPNVVEILTKPTSLEKFKKNASTIQKMIWESAAEAGLSADPDYRAGHFNFGVKDSFAQNTQEFLKFIVDFANRPELAIGIFRASNPLNSPHLAQLSPYQRSALADIARKAQNKKDPLSKLTVKEMAQHLVAKVFYQSATASQVGSSAWYYQALGLKSILEMQEGDDAPFEIRSVRSQRDVYDFILIAEIVEARIAYLKKLPAEFSYLVTQTSKTQFTEKELAARFYIYLEEAGLSWERYKRILPENISVLDPKEIFHDVQQLARLLDIAPTSPWLQARLQDILAHPDFPSEHRALLLSEMEKLSKTPGYSYEMKQGVLKLKEKLQTGAIGSCRAIFL